MRVLNVANINRYSGPFPLEVIFFRGGIEFAYTFSFMAIDRK